MRLPRRPAFGTGRLDVKMTDNRLRLHLAARGAARADRPCGSMPPLRGDGTIFLRQRARRCRLPCRRRSRDSNRARPFALSLSPSKRQAAFHSPSPRWDAHGGFLSFRAPSVGRTHVCWSIRPKGTPSGVKARVVWTSMPVDASPFDAQTFRIRMMGIVKIRSVLHGKNHLTHLRSWRRLPRGGVLKWPRDRPSCY